MANSKSRSSESSSKDSPSAKTAPATPLKHNPFASLRGVAPSVSTKLPSKAVSKLSDAEQALTMDFQAKLLVREELDGQDGKVITRIIGVPSSHLAALGAQMRKGLGCSAAIEGRDLLLMGALDQRAAAWLRDAGVSEVVRVKQALVPVQLSQTGFAGGTERAQIRRGLRVAIVQKEHQESGELTEGVVQDLLTSSANHPRGIKVRLESGLVGRVRRILG